MSNPILDSSNKSKSVAGLISAQTADSRSLSGVPLGTSPSGELVVKTANLSNLQIPAHDNLVIAYVGSTNNIDTVTYKVGLTTVGTLTITYIGGVPVADDALIETVVLS